MKKKLLLSKGIMVGITLALVFGLDWGFHLRFPLNIAVTLGVLLIPDILGIFLDLHDDYLEYYPISNCLAYSIVIIAIAKWIDRWIREPIIIVGVVMIIILLSALFSTSLSREFETSIRAPELEVFYSMAFYFWTSFLEMMLVMVPITFYYIL